MNMLVIHKEVKSQAMKEISMSLNCILDAVREKRISLKQAVVEITGHKHIIQTIALDWHFNKMPVSQIPQKRAMVEERS